MRKQDPSLPFSFQQPEIDPAIRQSNWKTIEAAMATPKVASRRWPLYAAALGLVLALLGSVLWFRNGTGTAPAVITAATAYGEMKTIRLPDESIVVLNGHSAIRINAGWSKNQCREVWLDGEAFFQVKHLNRDTTRLQPHERFLVHCNDLTVEVLGTAFDIRQRRGKTEVVLQSGSISLSLHHQPEKKLLLHPGELFTYDQQQQQYVQTTTEAADYTAWKEKKLILTNPTVEELIAYLEDNYGKRIVLNDASKRKVRIEGPILLTNLDDALFVISVVLKANIERNDSMILLKPR